MFWLKIFSAKTFKSWFSDNSVVISYINPSLSWSRSRSVFGTIGGMLHTLIGGNITLFTELCEKTRDEAFEMMISHAEDAGANAIVGIRYDATEVMGGVTEVLCYGTAVIVTPRK